MKTACPINPFLVIMDLGRLQPAEITESDTGRSVRKLGINVPAFILRTFISVFSVALCEISL